MSPLTHRFVALLVAILLTVALLIVVNRTAETETSAEKEGGLSGEVYRGDEENWEAHYDTAEYVYGKEPARFVKEHVDLLPMGRVLDIAMGEGRNSVFLAKKGFQVEGVDLSTRALAKALKLAKENGVSIRTIHAELRNYAIEPESYDVILNINFLMRELIPRIRAGLRHGGVVVFENATTDQLNLPGAQILPKKELLEPGELKRLFNGFDILVYREFIEEKEAKAYLVARKP